MTKNIFIIGNGFDLDLGMKTKYSDFANNEKYWPVYSGRYPFTNSGDTRSLRR